MCHPTSLVKFLSKMFVVCIFSFEVYHLYLIMYTNAMMLLISELENVLLHVINVSIILVVGTWMHG